MTKRPTKSTPTEREDPTDNPRQAERRPKNVLEIPRHATKSDDRVMAEVALSPIFRNSQTFRAFNRGARFGGEELDGSEVIAVMRDQANAVQAGDLSGPEETLTAQAAALDAIFNAMAFRAASNIDEYLPAAETFMRLALKCQAQCRATIQTLAEMKNPHPATFVRQANFAGGHQQVNNGTQPPGPSSRAEILVNPSNELLELNHEQRLDTGAADKASGVHPQLATVGPVHRPKE